MAISYPLMSSALKSDINHKEALIADSYDIELTRVLLRQVSHLDFYCLVWTFTPALFGIVSTRISDNWAINFALLWLSVAGNFYGNFYTETLLYEGNNYRKFLINL